MTNASDPLRREEAAGVPELQEDEEQAEEQEPGLVDGPEDPELEGFGGEGHEGHGNLVQRSAGR